MKQITKSIPSDLSWDAIPIDYDFSNTILDEEVKTNMGYTILPVQITINNKTFPKNSMFPIPKIVGSYYSVKENEYLVIYLTPLQRLYNSLIYAIETLNNSFITDGRINWLRNIVKRLITEVENTLVGKEGVLRNTFFNYPMPFSGRVVATPEVSIQPNEVLLPAAVVRNWISSKQFKDEMNISGNKKECMDQLIGKRCLIGRQPTHRITNLSAFVIAGYTHNTIAIHPISVSLFDGDFDGDTFWFAIDNMIPTEMYFENIFNNYSKVDKEYTFVDQPTKYSDLQKCIDDTRKNIGMSLDPFVNKSYPTFDIQQISNGLKEDDFLNKDASLSYKLLKRDTAVAGGISGTIIAAAISTEDVELVRQATIFRHILCQVALDCKHGTEKYIGSANMKFLQNLIYTQTKRSNDIGEVINKIDDGEVGKHIIKLLSNYEDKNILRTIAEKVPEFVAAKNNGKIYEFKQIYRKILDLSL